MPPSGAASRPRRGVGEYYSSHYLDSTFAKDVKELVAKWNEQGSQSPPRRLQNLSQYYFRAKMQALDEEKPIRRQFAGEEVQGWHAHLLQALGYNDLTPFDHPGYYSYYSGMLTFVEGC